MANSDIHSTFFLGATAHLTNKAIIKITWKNNKPIRTEQWPIVTEKLQAAKELTDTQLEWKHIEESCSPLLFVSLIFTVICKASSNIHLAFLHFFFLEMVLIPASCTMSWTSVDSSSSTLSIRSQWIRTHLSDFSLFITKVSATINVSVTFLWFKNACYSMNEEQTRWMDYI